MAEIDWKAQYEIERQAKEAALAEADDAMRLNDSLRAQLAAANKALEEARGEAEQLRDEAVQRIIDTPDDETIARAVAEFGSAEEAVKSIESTRLIFEKARAETAETALAAVTKERDELERLLKAHLAKVVYWGGYPEAKP